MTLLGAAAFDDAANAILDEYVKADGSRLSDAEKQEFRDFLRTSAADFESELDSKLQGNRAIVDGDRPVYTFWSDGRRIDAETFTEQMRKSLIRN